MDRRGYGGKSRGTDAVAHMWKILGLCRRKWGQATVLGASQKGGGARPTRWRGVARFQCIRKTGLPDPRFADSGMTFCQCE
jgi:hypothetical protein